MFSWEFGEIFNNSTEYLGTAASIHKIDCRKISKLNSFWLMITKWRISKLYSLRNFMQLSFYEIPTLPSILKFAKLSQYDRDLVLTTLLLRITHYTTIIMKRKYFRIETWHIVFSEEYLPWNKNESPSTAAFMKVYNFSWQKLLSQIYQK